MARSPLGLNPMGYGMAAPTIREHAQDDDLKRHWLRPLATTEDLWCQLFSEPGAGSDLAGLATSAVLDGDEWVINGQKVWTSLAHRARWGLLLARTNPDVPKHKGLTYFVIDMHGPGVETRPLRQLTGQAEFNEVYFTDARIPDAAPARRRRQRLARRDDHADERAQRPRRQRQPPRRRHDLGGRFAVGVAPAICSTPVLRDRLTQLWLRSEAQRLTAERSRATAGVGGPGPEGSIGKMVGAELNQHIYEWCMDLLGAEGILYHGYAKKTDPDSETDWRGPIQQRFLRSRANTIEGGTSEVMRNILGERVLGLPGDLRADTHGLEGDSPWLSSAFTDEQAQLRSAVRKFCADNFGEETVRRLMESDPPFDPTVWAPARRRARGARALGARG